MANASVQKTWDYIRGMKQAYLLTFSRKSPSAQMVLRNLAEFCRANETVYGENDRLTYVLIGRNEVWKKIQDYLNLSSEDLYRIRTGQQLNLEDDEQ